MTRAEKEMLIEIGNLIYKEFGIFISEKKFGTLEPKIRKMMMHEHYSSIEQLYQHLMSGDRTAVATLIQYITTNHTFFFREPDHFDNLLQYIRQQPKSEHTIWCAACSTGEEPYSIAMTLLDAHIENFRILASDLDKTVLKEFNEGIYHESRFQKTTRHQKLTYFERAGEDIWRAKPFLRSHVAIKALNLMDPLAFEKPFDYIFCRNVFIYFDEVSRLNAIKMLTSNLRIDGRIFIGHTETLFDIPANLKKDGHSIYKRIQ
jgi:chemotaxis protein methyltransferase CheR